MLLSYCVNEKKIRQGWVGGGGGRGLPPPPPPPGYAVSLKI